MLFSSALVKIVVLAAYVGSGVVHARVAILLRNPERRKPRCERAAQVMRCWWLGFPGLHRGTVAGELRGKALHRHGKRTPGDRPVGGRGRENELVVIGDELCC